MICNDVVLPFFIEKDLRLKILRFVEEYEQFFTWNFSGSVEKNRKFCNLNLVDHPLKLEIQDLSNKIFSKINMNTSEEEKLFGNFIGVNLAGGFVQPHTDETIEGYNHIRVNFFWLVNQLAGECQSSIIRNIE